MFVYACSKGPSWFGGRAYVWRKGGGGGVPFTATMTHALPLWLPGERRVIKPKTTSMRDRDTYIDTIGHGSLNASHEDRRRTKQTW